MKTIVNINHRLGLGREGELLVNIPEDMRFFRNETLGKSVIMGRKTLMSFPGEKPLKHRINIVLTRDASLIPEESKKAADIVLRGKQEAGAETDVLSKFLKGDDPISCPTILITAPSRDEVLDVLSLIYGRGETNDAYIIGGASIYELFLNDCDTLLITENDAEFEADKYFPDFKSDPGWRLVSEGELREYEGIHYRFNRYERLPGEGYYMFYKPKGVSLSRLKSGFPPGMMMAPSLDKLSEGLLFITDDECLTKRLGSAEKTYYAELSGPLTEEIAGKIPADVTRLSEKSFFISVNSLTPTGLRQLINKEGLKIFSLKRILAASVAIDPLLTPGGIRKLSPSEISRLKEI